MKLGDGLMLFRYGLVGGALAAMLAFIGVLWGQPAIAQERIALVIGNGAYHAGAFGELKNPVNDARLMERTLKDLGFDVVKLENATEDQMEDAIGDLGARLNAAGQDSVGVFYFAGHGVLSQGRNYMIPVDSRARTEQAVWNDAPRMGQVEEAMAFAGNRVNFIFYDACRYNNLPVAVRGGSSVTSLRETRAEGLLVSYASRPGAPSSDGSGSNSAYATALARYLKTAGLEAVQVFTRVERDVRAATGNAQQPWVEGTLAGADFCFTDCREAPTIVMERAPARELGAFIPRGATVVSPTLAPSESSAPRGVARDFEGDWVLQSGAGCGGFPWRISVLNDGVYVRIVDGQTGLYQVVGTAPPRLAHVRNVSGSAFHSSSRFIMQDDGTILSVWDTGNCTVRRQ